MNKEIYAKKAEQRQKNPFTAKGNKYSSIGNEGVVSEMTQGKTRDKIAKKAQTIIFFFFLFYFFKKAGLE